jgi:S-adenosylmethionine:tRNA ribosyltransferase-isomerase
MLVVDRATGALAHRRFADLPGYLAAGDIVVFNNTRVIAARLFAFRPTGGRAEFLLLEPRGAGRWEALVRARAYLAPGSRLRLEQEAGELVVEERTPDGRAVIRLAGDDPAGLVERVGHVPLPPYILKAREGGSDEPADRDRYQTLFARVPGAVAAPTAGLHFTPEVLAELDRRGVHRAELTLHTGIGTFRPVTAETVEDHVMDEERYEVSPAAAEALESARSAGGRILAVGSTSVRTLETVAAAHGCIVPAAGRTRLFIRPPYAFRAVDAMLTNFHLPRSTLLMMICALAGRDLILRAYEEAVRERYRFFSYGDCMLIL